MADCEARHEVFALLLVFNLEPIERERASQQQKSNSREEAQKSREDHARMRRE